MPRVPTKKPRAAKAEGATETGDARGTKLSPAHQTYYFKIAVLRRLLDRCASQALTEHSGLTLAEWRVLTHLYSSPPINARQLSLRLHADKAEVSRACAGLVARGYAHRRADPEDRRSTLIVITPRGERLHDAAVPMRQAFQKELEASLDPDQAVALHRILDKLIRYVLLKTDAGN